MAAALPESSSTDHDQSAEKWLVAVAVMLATAMEWIDGTVMAFVDDFRLLAYIFFIMTPVALFMHKAGR